MLCCDSSGGDDDSSDPGPLDYIYIDDSDVCGEFGSLLWSEEAIGITIYAFQHENACGGFKAMEPALNILDFEFASEYIIAESAKSASAACEALLKYHKGLSEIGFYDVWYPIGSCTYSATFQLAYSEAIGIQNPTSMTPTAILQTTDADVYEAIQDYIGDCSALESWDDWDTLYAPFFDGEYWPGNIYRADSEEISIQTISQSKLRLEGDDIMMQSQNGELIEVDLELDASYCDW